MVCMAPPSKLGLFPNFHTRQRPHSLSTFDPRPMLKTSDPTSHKNIMIIRMSLFVVTFGLNRVAVKYYRQITWHIRGFSALAAPQPQTTDSCEPNAGSANLDAVMAEYLAGTTATRGLFLSWCEAFWDRARPFAHTCRPIRSIQRS